MYKVKGTMKRVADEKIIFSIEDNWGVLRQTLFNMGFTDSVHKCSDGGDRWWLNGKEFSLKIDLPLDNSSN